MRRSNLVFFCLAIVVAIAFVPLSFAQQAGSAVLSGRVTDASGSAINGARVAATLRSTGATRDSVTNSDGLYVLANLPAGEYKLVIDAAGFSETIYNSVTLHVGETTQLDVSPKVTSVTETIVIDAAAAPLLNTSSSVVDGIISSQSIETLPLNGRNFLELALLIPGNSPAPNFDPTKSNVVLISSAGQLGRSGNVTIDGADDNDDAVGGPLQNISEEAVQEFQIATNRFSAELGRSGSSVINIVTKQGTNDLHGTASFFWRDRHFQGLPATFDRSLSTVPPFDREQYSGALGGPIARDKAWWFASLEYRNQNSVTLVGQRNLAAQTIDHVFAPTPLTDLLSTERADWNPSTADHLGIRYSIERESDTSVNGRLRALAAASYRNNGANNYHSVLSNWTHVISSSALNSFSFSVNRFYDSISPTTVGPQLTFPDLLGGAGFDVPQRTTQNRYQFSDTFSLVRGAHSLRFGGDIQIIHADFFLGVFQQGRIELVENFTDNIDRNGDGKIDDNDLLFAVTLRSGNPTTPLDLPNSNNTHVAGFFQDDWRVRPNFTINAGLRYEIDSDVKDVSRINQLNPVILPFLHGKRARDKNNFGPRIGFNWAAADNRTSVHGGYGIYYDRVTLEIQSLERGLDGRSLPIDVRAGNMFFLNPDGTFAPGAPTLSNPFTGFILTGQGAAGINIIDNSLQNPEVQQFNLGIQRSFGSDFSLHADYLHNLGTHFIINRVVGTVFNPVVGGPDSVVNLESSVNTKYDGLLLSLQKRLSHRTQFMASYTLSKSFNYANDEQIPFAGGPLNSNDLGLEYGPAPNDQRHRFTFSGLFELPYGIHLSPIFTLASGVPMDILLPDASTRIPVIQRNAGGRQFHTAAQLNAFITQYNANVADPANQLPFVLNTARFNDSFNSFDMRLSRSFRLRERFTLEPMVEVFNFFNVTNILGTSNVNYSGFNNALVRDSNNINDFGYLKSSSFGSAVTTAGGVFGSGGPRAFQFAVRLNF